MGEGDLDNNLWLYTLSKSLKSEGCPEGKVESIAQDKGLVQCAESPWEKLLQWRDSVLAGAPLGAQHQMPQHWMPHWIPQQRMPQQRMPQQGESQSSIKDQSFASINVQNYFLINSLWNASVQSLSFHTSQYFLSQCPQSQTRGSLRWHSSTVSIVSLSLAGALPTKTKRNFPWLGFNNLFLYSLSSKCLTIDPEKERGNFKELPWYNFYLPISVATCLIPHACRGCHNSLAHTTYILNISLPSA